MIFSSPRSCWPRATADGRVQPVIKGSFAAARTSPASGRNARQWFESVAVFLARLHRNYTRHNGLQR